MSESITQTKTDLSTGASAKADVPPDWLRVVQDKVESLRFGIVQLVVHDGRVTQIERTEKTRISPGVRKSDSD